MQLSEDKITRGNAVEGVKTVDSTAVSILMSWVRVHLHAHRTPQIRCVPEKMLSLMKLYGVLGLLSPYFVE